MLDMLFALLGVLGFALFCGILIAFVPHGDLVTVVVIVILMVCYDFVRELFLRKRG